MNINNFVQVCPKCGRGYIRDIEHRCDPLDTDIAWSERISSLWFVAFVVGVMVVILMWLL